MAEKGKKEKEVHIGKRKGEMVSRRPSDIFAEIDRIFEDFRTGFHDIFDPERRWIWPVRIPGFTLPEVRAPFCDLIDTGKEYRLCAEIPGIPKDKIDINIDENGVEISAEAQTESEEEKKGYVGRERTYSKFYRSMNFPEKVNPEKAQANLENGILELIVPKRIPIETKKRKVIIK